MLSPEATVGKRRGELMERFVFTTARYLCPPQQLVWAWLFGPAGRANEEWCKAEESQGVVQGRGIVQGRALRDTTEGSEEAELLLAAHCTANHGVSVQELRPSWEQDCEMSPENQGMACGLITCVKMPLCFNSLFSEMVLSCVRCRPLNGAGDFEESLAELWSLC